MIFVALKMKGQLLLQEKDSAFFFDFITSEMEAD